MTGFRTLKSPIDANSTSRIGASWELCTGYLVQSKDRRSFKCFVVLRTKHWRNAELHIGQHFNMEHEALARAFQLVYEIYHTPAKIKIGSNNKYTEMVVTYLQSTALIRKSPDNNDHVKNVYGQGRTQDKKQLYGIFEVNTQDSNVAETELANFVAELKTILNHPEFIDLYKKGLFSHFHMNYNGKSSDSQDILEELEKAGPDLNKFYLELASAKTEERKRNFPNAQPVRWHSLLLDQYDVMSTQMTSWKLEHKKDVCLNEVLTNDQIRETIRALFKRYKDTKHRKVVFLEKDGYSADTLFLSH